MQDFSSFFLRVENICKKTQLRCFCSPGAVFNARAAGHLFGMILRVLKEGGTGQACLVKWGSYTPVI